MVAVSSPIYTCCLLLSDSSHLHLNLRNRLSTEWKMSELFTVWANNYLRWWIHFCDNNADKFSQQMYSLTKTEEILVALICWTENWSNMKQIIQKGNKITLIFGQVFANSVDTDQTAPEEQFDQGLHCLPYYHNF